MSEKYWKWGPLVLASLLMLLVSFTGSNQRIFLWLNGLSRYTGDAVWASVTILGDGLVCFVLLLPWIRRRPDVVWSGILGIALTASAVQGLKFIFAAPRPPVVLNPQTFHLIGRLLVWGSFPSGHTANIFTLVGIGICAVSRTSLRVLLIGYALLIGLSRVVVGVHWPLDILGGVLVGWLMAWIGRDIALQWRWGGQRPGQWLVGIFLLTAAVWLGLKHDTGYPQAILLQRVLAVVCIICGGWELVHLIQTQYEYF